MRRMFALPLLFGGRGKGRKINSLSTLPLFSFLQSIQTSFFETIWTVGLYVLFERHYTSLAISDKPRPPLPERIDQRAGQSHLWRNGTVRVRKLQSRLNELMIYVSPLLFLDLLLIKKFKGVSLEAMIASGGYDPALLATTVSLNNSSVNNSNNNNSNIFSKNRPANIATTHFLAPSVHNMTLSSPLQLTRALPLQPPSSRSLLLELMASIIIYDAVFFLAHLSLHKIPILYNQVHATHHNHAEIHAQITNKLDIGERLLLVLTANFALQIIGAHVLTRTLFVPCFVLFLVQNHCGLDILSYDKILPKGWGGEWFWYSIGYRNVKWLTLSMSSFSWTCNSCTASSLGPYWLCTLLSMV